MKNKLVYICSNCGTSSLRWEGKCPSCQEWNTMIEEVLSGQKQGKRLIVRQSGQAILLNKISGDEVQRISIDSDPELQRTLGGGIVPGSIILLGGQPGIGKSTLMLQLACNLNKKVVYVSGEESAYQIKLRADRISHRQDNCYIYCETEIERILDYLAGAGASLVLIDSIQTLRSSALDNSAGSITQVKECASMLQQYAKESNTPVFIVSHITKDGSLAGPKILEHIVDVVLQFEGDQNYFYRILRTTKNRFGSTDEIGIYQMENSGMTPVVNPSQLFFSQSDENLSGCSIGATIEGIRPLLIETQALVSTSIFGNPQRSTTGFDIRRLSMLLAVLEKKCGLFFSQQDVFLNIAGGVKISDPAIDLSVIAALISSLHDISISKKICFAGEISLSGEVRAVNRIDQRIMEAKRLGFNQIVISKYNKLGTTGQLGIEISEIGKVQELIQLIFS